MDSNQNKSKTVALACKGGGRLDANLSQISVLCRICYDNDKDEPLIAPCRCKGTVAFVHRTCLERWLAESNTTMCELCHVFFKTERSPKYEPTNSICKFIREQREPGGMGRGIRSDIIACTVITPIAIIVTYVCLFSSDYYNQKKFIMVPAARWTSISLLIMIGIMLVGYYLWVYSVIRLHSRMWYNWWQRECVVRYIPPSMVNLCCRNQTDVNPNNTPESGNDVESTCINVPLISHEAHSCQVEGGQPPEERQGGCSDDDNCETDCDVKPFLEPIASRETVITIDDN